MFISICQRIRNLLSFFPSEIRNSLIFLVFNSVKVQTCPFKIKKKPSYCYYLGINVHFSFGFRSNTFQNEWNCVQFFFGKRRKVRNVISLIASVRTYLPQRFITKRQSDGVLFDSIEFICWPFVCGAQSKSQNDELSWLQGKKWKELRCRCHCHCTFKFKWMHIWNMSQYKFAK